VFVIEKEARMDPYQQLAAALAEDGILCRFQAPGQMVVSAQEGPVWPDRGNSFWVTYVQGRWHLFTWSPRGYAVSAGTNMARLCRICMAHESSAMPRVPAHIVEEFGLSELSEHEAQAVLAKMSK
jgi:hypothetical protein